MIVTLSPLASIYWNPDRFIFTVPVIDRPIAWYGFFFVLGFFFGYFMMIRMFCRDLRFTQYVCDRDIISWPKLITSFQVLQGEMSAIHKEVFSTLPSKTQKEILNFNFTNPPSRRLKDEILEAINTVISKQESVINRGNIDTYFYNIIYSVKDLASYLTDRLTWFIIAGTLIGARLGHVFFYDWPRYSEHPLDIVKIWEGGLASHGGAIGVILAIWLYFRHIRPKFPEISFVGLLDNIVVPTALVCFFIRIGNFFNQEIVGTQSDLPWAVRFGRPFDAYGDFPRHPVQLYEAFSYLATYFLLLWLWKTRSDKLKKGFMTGLFFTLVFSARFFIEFVKAPQGMMIDESFLQTGQYLSIPFILLGLWLMIRPVKR